MGFYVFGVGTAVCKPFGPNAAANPTPMQLGTMQEITVDIAASQKELFGKLQFPVAIARTQGKINFKAKFATFYAKVFNDLFFGASVNVGSQVIGVIDEIHTPSSGSVTITVAAGTFKEDQGVRDVNTGTVMTRVTTAPAVMQYSVVESTGVYTFNVAQTTAVFISYNYTSSSATTGTNVNVTNKPMGSMPTFETWLYNNQFGNNIAFQFPNCISSKLSFNFKNEDFAIPEFDFSAFSDNAGNIFYEYMDQ